MTLEASTKRGSVGSRALGWLSRQGQKEGIVWRLIAVAGVLAIFCTALRTLFEPWFDSLTAYGFHDWDSHSAYRFATVASLKRYHELPWWNPWMGGGFPAWAYVEGATNFISPYLPLYLTLPVQAAERFEVVGASITGLLSAYALASRFTRSAALRALAAVTYAINGRWALQAAVGHSWHMQYAWLPLAIYYFDLSVQPGKGRYAFACGVVLSILIYMGGIYPLPHTALSLVIYVCAVAAVRRAWAPFARLAVAGFSGIGLAAPKLLPLVDLMLRFPRKVASAEAIDFNQLVAMMTDPNQSYVVAPVAVPYWGWHEYGIYVGPWVAAAMLVGVVCATERRAVPLRLGALAFFLLGMGAFHAHSPWTLLHQMPVFSSQHVPTRFLFPAMLFAILAFVSFAARVVDRTVAAHRWVDLLLLVPVLAVATDITSVGRKSTQHAFYMFAPPITPNPQFHQSIQNPYSYSPPDWAGATLLNELANVGLIGSYGLPPLEPGAIGAEQPGYRGEAYVVRPTPGDPGDARVVSFTPNTAVVDYKRASPGSFLVYNMNFDPSWNANGKPAVNLNKAVAVPLTAPEGRVRFSYFPRMLPWGLVVFALTLGLGFGLRPLMRVCRAARTGQG